MTETSNETFGKIGFILSWGPLASILLLTLVSLITSWLIPDVKFNGGVILIILGCILILSPIISAICCIIQLKRFRTGLAISGLVISIINLVVLFIAIVLYKNIYRSALSGF